MPSSKFNLHLQLLYKAHISVIESWLRTLTDQIDLERILWTAQLDIHDDCLSPHYHLQCPVTVVKQFWRHVSAASSAPVCVRRHQVTSVSVMIQFTLQFTSSPGHQVRTLHSLSQLRDPGAPSHHSSRLSPHLLAFCYDCLCWCKQTPGGRDNKTRRPRFVCVSKQIFITDFFKPNKTKSQEPDC